jgi:hypothetical protein
MATETDHTTESFSEDIVDSLGDAFDKALETVEGNDADSALEKEGDEAKTAEAVSEAKDEEGEGETPNEPEESEGTEQEDEAVDAPGHWPKDLQDQFSELDKASQDILIERDKTWEAQTTRKSMELSDQAKFAETVQGMLSPEQTQSLRLSGQTQLDFLSQITAAADLMRKDPRGYIEWIATQSKVDLTSYGSDPDDLFGGNVPDESKDDTTQISRDDVEELVAHRMESERSNALIASFTGSTDEKGEALYPHFEALQTKMGMVMQSDNELKSMPDSMDKLVKAYDMAVYLDPVLREEAIKGLSSQQEEETTKAKSSTKAKQAKSAIKPKSPSSSKLVVHGTLDDIISDALGSMQ